MRRLFGMKINQIQYKGWLMYMVAFKRSFFIVAYYMISKALVNLFLRRFLKTDEKFDWNVFHLLS